MFMAVTSLIAIVSNTEIDSSNDLTSNVPMSDPTGLGVSITILYLTLGYHTLIPDIIHPLNNKKRNAESMIFYVFGISGFFVLLTGLSTIFAVEDVQRLSSLNWIEYSNGENDGEREWWTYAAGWIIGIFPAFDVTSVYSIMVENVVDNANAIRYHGLKDYSSDITWIFWAKVCVLVVTLVAPMYFYDLGLILAVAGTGNLIFILIFIGMFGIASLMLVPQKCGFDNFLTNLVVLRFLLIFYVLFSIGILGSIFYNVIEG